MPFCCPCSCFCPEIPFSIVLALVVFPPWPLSELPRASVTRLQKFRSNFFLLVMIVVVAFFSPVLGARTCACTPSSPAPQPHRQLCCLGENDNCVTSSTCRLHFNAARCGFFHCSVSALTLEYFCVCSFLQIPEARSARTRVHVRFSFNEYDKNESPSRSQSPPTKEVFSTVAVTHRAATCCPRTAISSCTRILS